MDADQTCRLTQLNAAHESGAIDNDTYQAAIAALGVFPSPSSVTTTGSVGGSVSTGTITADIFIGGNATLIFDDHARRAKDALDNYLQRLVRNIGTRKLAAINTKKLDQSLEQFALREVNEGDV